VKSFIIILSSIFISTTNAHTVIGLLQGEREILITTKSQGELKKLFFKEGQEVKSGDIIGSLDSKKEKIEKELAKQELIAAKNDYLNSKKLKKYLPKDELTKKKNDSLRKESIHELKIYNFNAKQIKTPIDGIISKIFIKEGENVSTGQKAVEIVQVKKLIIDLDVDPKFLGDIERGSNLSFTSELHPNKKFKAKIFYVSPVIDKASGTINIKLNLNNLYDKDNNFILKPGTLVKVSIN